MRRTGVPLSPERTEKAFDPGEFAAELRFVRLSVNCRTRLLRLLRFFRFPARSVAITHWWSPFLLALHTLRLPMGLRNWTKIARARKRFRQRRRHGDEINSRPVQSWSWRARRSQEQGPAKRGARTRLRDATVEPAISASTPALRISGVGSPKGTPPPPCDAPTCGDVTSPLDCRLKAVSQCKISIRYSPITVRSQRQ